MPFESSSPTNVKYKNGAAEGDYSRGTERHTNPGVQVFSGWKDPSEESWPFRVGDIWTHGGLPDGATKYNVIFDTDMFSDPDDLYNLKAIITLHLEGIINLIGVAITEASANGYAPGATRAVLDYYGLTNIEICSIYNDGWSTPTGVEDPMYKAIYDNYPHDGFGLADTFPSCVEKYTEWLSAYDDDSVIVFCVGFTYAIAEMLGQSGGQALLEAKIHRLCLVAGFWETPQTEFNITGSMKYTPDLNAVLQTNLTIRLYDISNGYTAGLVGLPYYELRIGGDDIVLFGMNNAVTGLGSRPAWGETSFLYEFLDQYQQNYTWAITGGVASIGVGDLPEFVEGEGNHEYIVLDAADGTAVRTHCNSFLAGIFNIEQLTWDGTTFK